MNRLFLAALLATASAAHAQTAHIQVHNPLMTSRPSEVLDLSLADLHKQIAASPETLVVQDHGTRLLTQVYNSKTEGAADRLLILVDLAAGETKTLDITSDPSAPAQQSKVTARKVPERADDFAWENDKVAFRVYGPALERTGEIASGIDVWSKRVPDFVTTTWYQRDEDSARLHKPELSYHRDNGQGMDSYEVGLSRGDGGTAIWADGKLFASKNVTTSTILANGPIRTDFVFHYAPWDAAGASVNEVKRVTLDAGSRMNRLRSTFTFTGAPTVTAAAGLAIHDKADVSAQHPESWVAVWDTPQSPSAGRIATGLVLPPGAHAEYKQLEPQGKVDGNALELYTIKSNTTLNYYAGNGWSLGDMPTPESWNAYLEDFHNRLTHPVTIKWLATKKK